MKRFFGRIKRIYGVATGNEEMDEKFPTFVWIVALTTTG